MADAAARAELRVKRGVCHAFFAYNVGLTIDLDECERLVRELTRRVRIRHKRRAPRYFEYQPAPLRVTRETQALEIGPFRTTPSVDLLLYDFGAVSVSYTIPFDGPLMDLLTLTEALYDDATLLAHSRRAVEQLVADVERAVKRPEVAASVEPYAILQVESLAGACAPAELYTTYAEEIAQILRSERTRLSAEEIEDALARRISFGLDDLAVIDWDAALLFDRDADDVRDVLEFANMELLEMRYLDARLDDALDQSYEVLTSRRRWSRIIPGSSGADLRRIGQLQVDAAVLFEGVNNTLKLLGEQYLARVYRLASERFHLSEWDASILRKLETLESIYQKMSDAAATWRMEILEWIIIVLITVSIIIPFIVPGAY